MRYVDYTSCCLYRVDPPDDEQQVCSKHVEAYYWNKLIEISVSCWFILYGYIMMHGQQNFKRVSKVDGHSLHLLQLINVRLVFCQLV